MASGGDIHSILHQNRNRMNQSQTQQRWFRPGQAPNIDQQEESDDDIFVQDAKSLGTHFTTGQIKIKQQEHKSNESDKDSIQESDQESIKEVVEVQQHQLKQKDPIKLEGRAALKARLLQQQEEEEISDEEQQEEEEEEEDLSDEFKSVNQDQISNYEQEDKIKILKPIFVPKEIRQTKEQEYEEEILIAEEKKKLEMRKKEEAKLIVLESIRTDLKDENELENIDTDNEYNLPCDNDKINQKLEYQQWRIRELTRIKNDRKERNKLEDLKKEIERRRNLTDEQRLLENKKLGSDATNVQKKTPYRFMQKFYHKGVFGDQDDPIFQRDYNTAVGEDLWDKSSLPSCLQKRRDQFGKRGQSKYTHLTDQDTTNFDPYFKKDSAIEDKMFLKLGGQKGQDINKRLKKVKKF